MPRPNADASSATCTTARSSGSSRWAWTSAGPRSTSPPIPTARSSSSPSAHEEAKEALAELRHLVRGFHPAILEDRGLDAALSSVVARCPVPVTLAIDVPKRPAAPIESTIYFVVTEALANVAKHSAAHPGVDLDQRAW